MASLVNPASRISSLKTPCSVVDRAGSIHSKEISLYHGYTERPLGWKPKRSLRNPNLRPDPDKMGVKKWDGLTRQVMEWDSLRRDPELWYPEGNCLVYLYGRGQSRRGPAFRVPISALLSANCIPLLQRFLVESSPAPPISTLDKGGESSFNEYEERSFELYIPAPPTVERDQVFMHHIATRNFFAWLFGKSLVGSHLGGALVGLLDCMNEFRSPGEANIQEIMDYMYEEGYDDMRNQPDYALAILFFAEHFHLNDLYIDAFAHCTGMSENLILCIGFEFISKASRALITQSRIEMEMRLDRCGTLLSSFLSEDLSHEYLGLSTGARAHLDSFRSFLRSYFITKFRDYPPISNPAGSAAFPKHIFIEMCEEFQKLYDFIADFQPTGIQSPQISQLEDICVLQNVQAFDSRHKYEPLQFLLPLVPELVDISTSRTSLGKRLFFSSKVDKMKPEPQLMAFSCLSKATNIRDQSLLDCTLVRAYREFEKDCVFSPLKVDKDKKISVANARKVRWILIYSILQTLLSATKVPAQVRDTQNVPYNLSVQTSSCPPWKEDQSYEIIAPLQIYEPKKIPATVVPTTEPVPDISFHLKSDLGSLIIGRKSEQYTQDYSNGSKYSTPSRKFTMRKVHSALHDIPELPQPKPEPASYNEFIIHKSGNGTIMVDMASDPVAAEATQRSEKEGEVEVPRPISMDSVSNLEHGSCNWSSEEPDSPTTSTCSSESHCRLEGDDTGADALKGFHRALAP